MTQSETDEGANIKVPINWANGTFEFIVAHLVGNSKMHFRDSIT